jgi:hypothetical protein
MDLLIQSQHADSSKEPTAFEPNIAGSLMDLLTALTSPLCFEARCCAE